jgi:serine/threonine protein kinase
MYQILIGVREMHEKKIAHRDLKPENILVNCKGEIKICDFGCSKIIDPKGKNTPYVMSQYYRAPELIMAITKYSVSVDMWSVGCILAELALLRPFFVGANEGDQLFAILKIMGSFTEEE